MVPPTLAQDLNRWLKAKGVSYESKIYPEMKHGFAARPDTGDPKIKEQYQKAFEDSVKFLQKHL